MTVTPDRTRPLFAHKSGPFEPIGLWEGDDAAWFIIVLLAAGAVYCFFKWLDDPDSCR